MKGLNGRLISISTESADVRVDDITKGSGDFVKSGLRVWEVMCSGTRFSTFYLRVLGTALRPGQDQSQKRVRDDI